jgi:hypothetical protein
MSRLLAAHRSEGGDGAHQHAGDHEHDDRQLDWQVIWLCSDRGYAVIRWWQQRRRGPMKTRNRKPACENCGKQDPRMMVLVRCSRYICGDCLPLDAEAAVDICGLTAADIEGHEITCVSDAIALANELGRTGSSPLQIVDEDFVDETIKADASSRGLDLKYIPCSLRPTAIKHFDDRNAIGFLCTTDNQSGLSLVFDNLPVLKAAGIYEPALVHAFTACRVNHGNWSVDVVEFMFDQCDKERLRACGGEIPGAGPFTLYRGVAGHGPQRRVRGFSWTDSLDVACWFASRFQHLAHPAVHTATVELNEILLFDGSREREFVVRPKTSTRMKLTDAEIRERGARWNEQKNQREAEMLAKFRKENAVA